MSLADIARHPFYRIASLAELCALLAERRQQRQATVLLAGGTDFMVAAKQRAPASADEPLPLVVDISRLPDLLGIVSDGESIRIGAAETFRHISHHPLVRERLPLLARCALDVGGPTVQARGTLGGNLATASPAADGVAALGACDAAVLLHSVRGRRAVPLNEFQTGYKQSLRQPDEVIVGFELTPRPRGASWYWRKVGARRAQAISKVALAAEAVVQDGLITACGLALASVAPVTALMPITRAKLEGRKAAELSGAELDECVDQDISPIDDLRSTREYRAHCARALVRDFARQLGAAV